MSAYFILAVAVVLAEMNNYFLHKFNNRNINNSGDALLFNSMISCIWIIILFLYSFSYTGKISIPSAGAVSFGILYGINLSCFLFFKMEAMTNGPIAITTLIASCSFVTATIFSAIYNREPVSAVQFAGIILMIISFVMCVSPKSGRMVLTAKWKILCFAFFLAGDIIGIINKLFRSSASGNEIDGMMLTASVISAILLFSASSIIKGFIKAPQPKTYRSGLFYIAACGAVSCVYSRLNVYLAGVLPGIVLFPVSNGCLIFLSSLIGTVCFDEKSEKIQIAGMITGFVSIIMIGCF